MAKSIWDMRFSSSKAVTFDEALKMSGLALDDWITMKGSHVLVGEGGEILAGLGGNFKNLSDVPRNTIKQREGESDEAFQKRAEKELGIISSKNITDKKQKTESQTKRDEPKQEVNNQKKEESATKQKTKSEAERKAERLQKKEAEYKKQTDKDIAQIKKLYDERDGGNDTRTWEKMNAIAKDVFERTERLEAEKLAAEGKTTVKKELAEREQIRNIEIKNRENSEDQLDRCMGVGWTGYGRNPRKEIDSRKSLIDYVEENYNYKLSSKEVSELLSDAGRGEDRYYNAYKNFKENAEDCWRDSLAITRNGHYKFNDDHLPLDIYESRNFREKFEKRYADKDLNKIFERREKKGLPAVYSDPRTPNNYMYAISRNNIYNETYSVPYDIERSEPW